MVEKSYVTYRICNIDGRSYKWMVGNGLPIALVHILVLSILKKSVGGLPKKSLLNEMSKIMQMDVEYSSIKEPLNKMYDHGLLIEIKNRYYITFKGREVVG